VCSDGSCGYLRWGLVEIHLSGFRALDPKTTTSVCFLWSTTPTLSTRSGPRLAFGDVDPDGNLLRFGSPLK
jgi:hypothetical protein